MSESRVTYDMKIWTEKVFHGSIRSALYKKIKQITWTSFKKELERNEFTEGDNVNAK